MLSWRTHPEEENLLRFCEGELPGRQAARVARHLDACWECRTQVDDLRKTIGEYVHYRQDLLQPSLPPPPVPWMDLSREFQRIRAEQSKSSGRGAIFRRPVAWLLVGGAVLLASSGIFLNRTSQSARKALDDSRKTIQTSQPTVEFKQRASEGSPPPPRVVPRASESPSISADDELNVIAALHRMGADLGDPIEVVRERDTIIVHGAGVDPARANQLRTALSGMPRVSIDLSAPALPAQADSRTPLVESGRESAVEPQISRQFSDRVAFQKVVDETLQSSEAMMARAHALRALADRFPAAVAAHMSPGSEALLASIRQEHTAAMANQVAAIHRSMSTLLRSSASAPAQEQRVPAATNWQEQTYQLFSSAAAVDHLLGALLAPTAGTQLGDSGAADLAAALAKLSGELKSYQHSFTGDRNRGLR